MTWIQIYKSYGLQSAPNCSRDLDANSAVRMTCRTQKEDLLLRVPILFSFIFFAMSPIPLSAYAKKYLRKSTFTIVIAGVRKGRYLYMHCYTPIRMR